MRAILRWTTAAFVIGAGTVGALGQEASAGGGGRKADSSDSDPFMGERRMQFEGALTVLRGMPGSPSGAAQKSTYLGLATSAVHPALQKQLKLKPGVGLVVDVVETGSPAEKAGVKEFDVLHKLDNQLLINAEQFDVLVRGYKPGTEVKLEVIREGNPQTLAATLAEDEMQPLRMVFPGMMSEPMADPAFVNQPRRVQSFVATPRFNRVDITSPDGKQKISAARVTIDNDKHKMTVSGGEGKRHLKVEDKAGKVLFEGPIDTPENLNKVPPDLRKAYEELVIDHAPSLLPAEAPGGFAPADPNVGKDADAEKP